MSFERLILAVAAIGLATAGPALAASSKAQKTDPATLSATGEAQNCITASNVTTVPAGDKYLLFKSGASNWYRNELRGNCPMQGMNRVLVFRNLQANQYCDLDMFDIVDSTSRMNYGGCSLGKFTPVKVPKGARF